MSTDGSAPARTSAICALATSMREASTFRSKLPAMARVTSVSSSGLRNSCHQRGEIVATADTAGSAGCDQAVLAGESGRL